MYFRTKRETINKMLDTTCVKEEKENCKYTHYVTWLCVSFESCVVDVYVVNDTCIKFIARELRCSQQRKALGREVNVFVGALNVASCEDVWKESNESFTHA